MSQDSNLVCPKATGLRPAGRSDVHDTHGVTGGIRTREPPESQSGALTRLSYSHHVFLRTQTRNRTSMVGL